MMVGGWQLPARNVVARFGCGFRLAMDKAPKLGELWQVLHRRDFFGGCPRASASSARFSDGLQLQICTGTSCVRIQITNTCFEQDNLYAHSTFRFNSTSKTIQSLKRYDLISYTTALNFSPHTIIVHTHHKLHSRKETGGQNKMHLAGAGQVMN
jgi:hypothetical protein